MSRSSVRAYNRPVLRALLLALLSTIACAKPDHASYLRNELSFLQLGVQLASEEKEVRRVLAQRGLRVVARLENDSFIALGAATRDGLKTAVRVISRRGVVVANDGALDDIFAPAKVVLIEHFGGNVGDSSFVAESRVTQGQDAGCVTLHRVLPDGNVVAAVLDVSALGSRACVCNLAPARSGYLAGTVAWPGLHALSTPQLDVELAFVETRIGEEPPLIPVLRIARQGEWLERERTRVSTLRLARAQFSERHAAGVARAAVALLLGQDTASQVSLYRNAVASVYPASTEADVMAQTAAHIGRGWLDAEQAPAGSPAVQGEPHGGEPTEPEPVPVQERADGDATMVEPIVGNDP